MLTLGLALSGAFGNAQETKQHEKAEVGKVAKNAPALALALKDASVTLEDGLRASEAQGKPISGKFEMEDGKLQLSVYTSKGTTFSEIVLDYKTGKILAAEPISDAKDLKDARKQADAMAKAKGTLADAVARAVKGHTGYRAVSAAAEVERGGANAEIGLLKGSSPKHVDEPR